MPFLVTIFRQDTTE